MHELAVTKSILRLVIDAAREKKARKVESVYLAVGGLRDLEEEWVQRYFDYISKGTMAEGARIKVTKNPALWRCKDCGSDFSLTATPGDRVFCPSCGGCNYALVSGRELIVEKMEVR